MAKFRLSSITQAEGKAMRKKLNLLSYQGFKVGELRRIFKHHQNRENWKYPVNAVIDNREEAMKLGIAIRYFQADEPRVSEQTVMIYPHPDALVKVPQTVWVVTSKGYQAW